MELKLPRKKKSTEATPEKPKSTEASPAPEPLALEPGEPQTALPKPSLKLRNSEADDSAGPGTPTAPPTQPKEKLPTPSAETAPSRFRKANQSPCLK